MGFYLHQIITFGPSDLHPFDTDLTMHPTITEKFLPTNIWHSKLEYEHGEIMFYVTSSGMNM